MRDESMLLLYLPLFGWFIFCQAWPDFVKWIESSADLTKDSKGVAWLGPGLSSSSANPQSWNRYAYTLNNPLIYADPNGEAAQLVITPQGVLPLPLPPLFPANLGHGQSPPPFVQDLARNINATIETIETLTSFSARNPIVTTAAAYAAPLVIGLMSNKEDLLPGKDLAEKKVDRDVQL